MSLIEANGRPHVTCPKCKTIVVWPIEFSEENKHLLAVSVRASVLEAAKLAHSKFGLSLAEGKALAFHITHQPGECHKCKSPLIDKVSICGKCHSANLDWQ